MKSFGPDGYPKEWDVDCLWNGKLSVHFGYPEHGWVLLSLLTTAYNGSLVIDLSDVFDPFWELVDLINLVADNKLPASFKIDEEGCYKELIVKPYSGRYDSYADIEFRINGDYWNEEKKTYEVGCYFLTRLKRSQFVAEFTNRLEDWIKNDYDPEGWLRSDRENDPDDPLNDLRNLDLAVIKEKVRQAGN